MMPPRFLCLNTLWSGRCVTGLCKGYSLVELVVVVAIVAVLAAVAMPAYSSYVMRARATEALTLAASYKTLVLENASEARPFNSGLTSDDSEYLDVGTDNVVRLRIVGETGAIVVETTARAGGGAIYLIPYVGTPARMKPLRSAAVPVGSISWLCASGGWVDVGGDHYKATQPANAAPPGCRPA